MKLQKIFAYDYKTKDGKTIRHHKYNLVVPEVAIQKLGLEGTEELEWEIQDNALKIRAVKKVRGIKTVK